MKIRALLLLLAVCGCTAQVPDARAPVYNVTVTDNSQWIVGDGNTAENKADTSTEQSARPEVSASAKSSGDPLFVFFLGFIIGALATGAGVYAWRKYIK